VVALDRFEIIPYVFTGIISGRWCEKVMPLFEQNEIVVDYKKRGFYESVNRSLGARLQAKIKRFPLEVRSSLDLLSLKIQSALK
jgi:hypothetical protein